MIYIDSGHAYLVCPNLVKLDIRHRQHPSKWPPCRAGKPCGRPHDHEAGLVTAEPHTVHDFFWFPGTRPPTEAERGTCDYCGAGLLWSDLDDPYDRKHLQEA